MIGRGLVPQDSVAVKPQDLTKIPWKFLLSSYDEVMRKHLLGTNRHWEMADLRGEIERRLKIADSPLGQAQMVLDQAQEICEASSGPTAEMVTELRARGKAWDMYTRGDRRVPAWTVRKNGLYLATYGKDSFTWEADPANALRLNADQARVLCTMQDGDEIILTSFDQ